ncbi:MAG: cupredoxin domain-containing protein [Gemmatimonadales bacterium]
MNRGTILAGLASLAALACSSGSSGTPAENTPAGDIQVGNNFFNPVTLSVAVGTTVTWDWNPGGVGHNVTFDDGGPNSSTQSSGTFARTFMTAGTYPYHCTIHGAAVMSGTITVTSTSGTTGTGGGSGAGGGTNGGYSGGM